MPLSTAEFKEALPEGSTLESLLAAVKHFSSVEKYLDGPTGLLSIEIKTPSPLCDPQDETEEDIVVVTRATVDAILLSRQK
jgi:hypothetical protein